MRPRLVLLAALSIILLLAGEIAVAGVVVVVQKGRAFSLATLRITRGDVARFSNDDKFLHQIFVASPSFGFESEEQEPGTSVEIQFSKAGTYEVRCHIHPKMLLTVDVR